MSKDKNKPKFSFVNAIIVTSFIWSLLMVMLFTYLHFNVLPHFEKQNETTITSEAVPTFKDEKAEYAKDSNSNTTSKENNNTQEKNQTNNNENTQKELDTNLNNLENSYIDKSIPEDLQNAIVEKASSLESEKKQEAKALWEDVFESIEEFSCPDSQIEFRGECVSKSTFYDFDSTASHVCWITVLWNLMCFWGNSYWQLWTWDKEDKFLPAETVSQLVSSVKLSEYHTCIDLTDSWISCSWWNWFWFLWNGNTSDASSFWEVSLVKGEVKDYVLWLENTCFLYDNWKVYCSWTSEYWQLWRWDFVMQDTPVEVHWLDNIEKLFSWGHTFCALDSEWALYCWWNNEYWNVWNWTEDVVNRPKKIIYGNVIDVKMSSTFSCALMKRSWIKCWWSNSHWQIWSWDDIEDWNNILRPTSSVFRSLWRSSIEKIALDKDGKFACALNSTWDVYCFWDNSSWQLWDNSTISSNIPVLVKGLPKIKDIIAWVSTVCALDINNDLWCWWNNSSWQMWLWDFQDRLTPSKIDFKESIKKVKITSENIYILSRSWVLWSSWSNKNWALWVWKSIWDNSSTFIKVWS